MTYYTYILTNWNNKVMYYCESMTDVKAAIARETAEFQPPAFC